MGKLLRMSLGCRVASAGLIHWGVLRDSVGYFRDKSISRGIGVLHCRSKYGVGEDILGRRDSIRAYP
jgi:hypothetical protein